MCGIAGAWTPGARPDREALGAMLESLDHRGPDGRGSHIDDERGLMMGHTRLSIIDLEGGQQPLHDPDAGNVLTVNGEFYDYKRIRAELTCQGARFRTNSDSEIALHLFPRLGLDFVHRLRGEFAFVLYDATEKRLVVVRDRFGIKPLYFHADGTKLVWGSEVKAVLSHPAVPRKLDGRAALHQLMQVMVPGTTAFAGVEALLPGHMLIAEERDGRLVTRTKRYWDFEFPRAGEHSTSTPGRVIAGVQERLLDSVATRLEADVPVGCYLSGGIDSCSILGVATPLQQSSVRAYTISFDSDVYDESAIAQEMAASTGADQVMMRVGGDELYGDHFCKVLWHTERTFYNTLAVAKYHMSRTVRDEGRKVVVTGEGSDELFGGYPFFKRDFLLHGSADPVDSAGSHSAVFQGAILAEKEQTHPAWEGLFGFTPSWIQPWLLTHSLVRPLLSAPLREELEGYDPAAAICASLDPSQIVGRHPLDMVQYSWSKTMLEGQILTWGGDRVDMAHSMEARPAFLDHHLAEYAATIPPELRIHGTTEKYVLREAMKGVLPKVLYEREKFAFMAPPSSTDALKEKRVRSLVEVWLSPEKIREVGLLDETAVAAFLERAWSSKEHATGARNDILVNHMLGLQMLDAVRRDPSRPPRADGS